MRVLGICGAGFCSSLRHPYRQCSIPAPAPLIKHGDLGKVMTPDQIKGASIQYATIINEHDPRHTPTILGSLIRKIERETRVGVEAENRRVRSSNRGVKA